MRYVKETLTVFTSFVNYEIISDSSTSFKDLYWKWKLQLMGYTFLLYVVGFAGSNIPSFPLLYPPLGLLSIIGISFGYFGFLYLFRTKPRILSLFLFIVSISGLYAITRTSFLLAALRTPFIICMCSLQIGKRYVIIIFLSCVSIFYFTYSGGLMDHLILHESFAMCNNNICTINREITDRLVNTIVWQAFGMALMCYCSEMTLEDGAKELEKYNKKLIRALKTKTEFLARCSHELRTPLTGIVGAVDVVLGTSVSTEQKKFLSIARDCSTNLTDIINDLLDFSKIEMDQLNISYSAVHLKNFVKRIFAPADVIATSKSLVFVHKVEDNVPEWMLTDELRLKQVLNNLLSNSIKFTERGQVTVVIEFVNNGVKFSVIDTGVGIPADKQSIVFEPFKQADDSTTRKFGGTGLGLAICKSIVDKMNGKIQIMSDGRSGTTFTVEIPYIVPSNDQIRAYFREYPTEHIRDNNGAIQRLNIRHQKVLVAEDNLVNQKVILRMLDNIAIAVDMASNGEEAVRKAREFHYPVILMDLEMPIKDGRSATKEIRRNDIYANTPIIGFTAHVLTEFEKSALKEEYGFTDFLIKPVSLNELRKFMNKVGV